jgi:histidinol-phosphate aminotransferase
MAKDQRDWAARLARPLVRALHPYTPGEQPKQRGLIKLNTNENPYPPSPGTLAAVRAATDGRLRLYPNPTADGLRARLAALHGCDVENIIVGNGSDELLAMAVRCFVEPAGDAKAKANGRGGSRETAQYFRPSYSLYPVLADAHGARKREVPLRADFGLPSPAEFKAGGWDYAAALTLITTPNAPSGRGYTTAELDRLCAAQRGVVVLDEAYADFAPENAMELALKHPHVLVARTFSKAYSLCFQRVGYMVGSRELIGALHKIRDSYNVNGLGQVAAEATIRDLSYYRRNIRRIIASRERLREALSAEGFEVDQFPSGDAAGGGFGAGMDGGASRRADSGAMVFVAGRVAISPDHGGDRGGGGQAH